MVAHLKCSYMIYLTFLKNAFIPLITCNCVLLKMLLYKTTVNNKIYGINRIKNANKFHQNKTNST